MASNIDQEMAELFRRISSSHSAKVMKAMKYVTGEELASTFNPEWTEAARQKVHLDSKLVSSARD